ncbi:hypothetical protein [Variovorax saccharolyticus]|uniref:hypothetical protein n=1 Tax=Variovorax saccharolyticus TaxID=3053516 RepID=UPI002574E535|nr:hypothetical protein [Variovorax sp. J31P216]MDM0024120.1 hypothetical protein [Variovorax sp. J31P216]
MRSEEQERDAFEVWAVTEEAELDIRKVRNENLDIEAYASRETFAAWKGWYSRAALARAPDAGEAVAWRYSPSETFPEEVVLTADEANAERASSFGWKVTALCECDASPAGLALTPQERLDLSTAAFDWKAEYYGAQEVLTEIRTALNASGYWPLGMDLVASIRGLLAATPAVAVQAEPGIFAPDANERLGEISQRVYLVATGETHEGLETYTRHDNFPPPLCDSELLHAHPKPAAPATAEDAVSDAEIEDAYRDVFGVTMIDRHNRLFARAILALRSGASAQHAEGGADHG